MARYECARCHEKQFTTNEPHLCADLAKRYARQARAVELVNGVLSLNRTDDSIVIYLEDLDDVSLSIVKALSGRELGD